MNTIEHGCPSHLGKNLNSLPWPKSYFSSLPQCPVLITSTSHWFYSIPFSQLRSLHTQFPPSRWLFSLPVPWLTFPFHRTQPQYASRKTPFLTITPVVLFCSPVCFPHKRNCSCYIACLVACFCLSSPSESTSHCGRDHTGLSCSISNTWHGAWDVVGPEYLRIVVVVSIHLCSRH